MGLGPEGVVDEIKLAGRMDELTSFIVMDVLERAQALEAQGHSVVHLEVGEPDFDPPPPVVEAMRRAVCNGKTHYTHSLGIWPLREAIARRYLERYGVEVSPERVCITTGTSAAFLLIFGALLETGEAVAMSDPGYPCYPNFVRFVGGRPRPVPIAEADGFQLVPERLEAEDLAGVRMFVVSSPANPTGTITGRPTYEWILEKGYRLVSDEIYHELVYTGEKEFSGLAVSDEAIVVDGFSKRWAMTGCRLGWMVVPAGLVRAVNRLSQNLYISPPTPSQWGGLAALEQGSSHVECMRQEYGLRNRLLVEGLRRVGFSVAFPPQGAFYVFADVSRFCSDSFQFCMEMLHQAHVAATPGIDFGRNETSRYVRFAYTSSQEMIREGLSRLEKWLATRL